VAARNSAAGAAGMVPSSWRAGWKHSN
jgi:hypothetical protein